MYIYIYIERERHRHMCVYIYIYCLLGGSETSAYPSDQFVHKPGPGIPTSSTPNQQPTLTATHILL